MTHDGAVLLAGAIIFCFGVGLCFALSQIMQQKSKWLIDQPKWFLVVLIFIRNWIVGTVCTVVFGITVIGGIWALFALTDWLSRIIERIGG